MQYNSEFVNFSSNKKVYCRLLIFYVIDKFDNDHTQQHKEPLMKSYQCNITVNLSISLVNKKVYCRLLIFYVI